MAHIREPRPDSGLVFEAKVLKTFQLVPFSLGADGCSPGPARSRWAPRSCFHPPWSAFRGEGLGVRFRANMAHVRQSRPDYSQSRPDSALDFDVKVLETL